MENLEYEKDPVFMDAIQMAFANNFEEKGKKKVSFITTNESMKRKKKLNFSKSTTLKTNSSREKGSQISDDIKFEDFDKFFQMFISNYAEEGYTKEEGGNSQKPHPIVHFMNNRENESEHESK